MKADNAKKCDRCGELYESKTPTIYIRRKIKDMLVDVDLCPKCAKVMEDVLEANTNRITITNSKIAPDPMYTWSGPEYINGGAVDATVC